MTEKRLIEIDPTAGFCFGVENAIRIAEEELSKGKKVYGLGYMVHNEDEIQRLRDKGLRTISKEDLTGLNDGKVILRAHGEPPSTYQLARENNIELIDATCPIVSSLQHKIKKRWKTLDHENEQLVIYGKEDHPETIGLLGQTNGEAILLTSKEDVEKVDPSKRIYFYSQTTMDPDLFDEILTLLKDKASLDGAEGVKSNCTICGQMKRRKPGLKEFALKHSQIIFICGKNSSNGSMLYNFCKQQNEFTHLIHSPGEVQADWLKKSGSIGISGATSTPVWQLELVKEQLESLMKD